jgi:hypothetical protein
MLCILFMATVASAEGVIDSLYLSLGAGPGRGRLDQNASVVYNDYNKLPVPFARESAALMDLRLGYILTPGIRVFLETCAWSRDREFLIGGLGVEWIFNHVNLRLAYALGASRVDYYERGDLKDKIDPGPGVIFGLGWQQSISRRLALEPQFIYFGHSGQDTESWADCYGVALNLTCFFGD